jgi:hypothetical protein
MMIEEVSNKGDVAVPNENTETVQEKPSKKQHDKGYRDVLSNKDSFLHFLNKYIKLPWSEGITKDDLTQIESTFITSDYEKRESDVIYKLENKNVYFYILLEQQSKTDFSMPFRLLRYMVGILTSVFKNTNEEVRITKDFRLPAIVPIVLYNGEDNWTAVQTYKEYTSNYGEFGDSIIDFKYILFDLNRCNKDDILTTYKLVDFVFTMDLNHSTRTSDDFKRVAQELGELQHKMTDDDVKTFVSWVANVLLRGEVPENFEEETVSAFRKGDVRTMTHAFDRLLEREKFSAVDELKLIITRNVLAKGGTVEDIVTLTELPQEEIEEAVTRLNPKPQ